MRYTAAFAILAALLIAGCEERTNMRVVPDRNGHAYQTKGTERVLPAGAAVPGVDEQVYTVKAGDTITSVSKKFKITDEWLIERNDLRDIREFKTGKNVIVPNPQAPAPKKK